MIQQHHIAAIGRRAGSAPETLADVLADIAAPQLNLDGPAITGYTDTDLMTSGWADVSGNARNALGTGLGINGVPPRYIANIQNGLSGARWSGIGNREYLRIATQNLNTGWSLTNQFTSYVVSKAPSNHNGGQYYWDNTTQGPFSCLMYWGDSNSYVACGPQGGGQFLTGAIGNSPNALEVFCVHGISGGTWEIMRNGVSAASATKTNSIASGSGEMLIGGYTPLNVATTEYFVGDIGDIIIFNTNHDATTRTRMNDALMNRWGI